MTIRLGVVMDPIESIHFKKDTTLAMCLEAQSRGWQIEIMTPEDLFCRDGQVFAHAKRGRFALDPKQWFILENQHDINCHELDVILMRKDPPFDTQYIYTTHLLELVEASGVLVLNKPQSLRDFNEKLATAWFPQCCPPTVVCRRPETAKAFLQTHGECVFKPLEGMGGKSIFRVKASDPNVNVICETLMGNSERFMMAQVFIPEIKEGDKRVLIIDGEPYPYALARVPAEGDSRGNLAAGAKGVGVELTERDRWIAAEVGPTLKQRGLIFVGLDIIGHYLTEINVTSPTCVREIDAAFGVNVSAALFDAIAGKLVKH